MKRILALVSAIGLVSSPTSAQLVINEVLFDPAPGNDVNQDGSPDTGDDEFIEIVNLGSSSVDLANYTLTDADNNQFTFIAGDEIEPNSAVLVFGGGSPELTLNGASVFVGLPTLNNGGDTITFADGAGNIVASITWAGGDASDESLNRSPDNLSEYVPHSTIPDAIGSESPGLTFDGKLFDPNAPSISLSPESIMLVESGGTTTAMVTLTLSEMPDSYPLTISLSNSNPAAATVPAEVELTTGTSTTFTVTAVDDNNPDSDQITQIFASAPGYNRSGIEVTVMDDGDTAEESTSPLLITQYYEGTSNNKYIELTNVSDTELDLSGFILTRWSNASTENWKMAGSSPGGTTLLDGILPAGASYILANPMAASPLTAADADVTSPDISFNGDDSMVLYQGVDVDPANIADAVSFTDLGNEGANTSFVRENKLVGFSLAPGSTILDADFTWTEVSLGEVDSASLGDDLFLGSSDLGINTAIVSFSASSAVVTEDSGTFDLVIQILRPDGNEVSVDVTLDAVNSTVEASEVSDFGSQTVVFPANASDGDTQTVTITLDNDALPEMNEVAIFTLGNIMSGGQAQVIGNDTFTLTVQDDDTVIPDLYISEIADPSDNSDARFVEIYNPTDQEVDLFTGDWNLLIYFNDNSSPGATILLDGIIPAMGTYVIAKDSAAYIAAYPGSPDADQFDDSINFNGNDNIELRFGGNQSTGILRDVYGMPGTNGEGMVWFYENSRVSRTTTAPNATYTESEWTITEGGVATMTPGQLTGDPPARERIIVRAFSINPATGDGSVTFEEDGISAYAIEVSSDLGQNDSFSTTGINVTNEGFNPDGTATFTFSDTGATGQSIRFYRVVISQ